MPSVVYEVAYLWLHKSEHEPIINQLIYTSFYESRRFNFAAGLGWGWFWFFGLTKNVPRCEADASNRHEGRVQFERSSCRCYSCGNSIRFRRDWTFIKSRGKCKNISYYQLICEPVNSGRRN